MNNEVYIRNMIINHIGIDITRKQLRKFIYKYNNFKLPIKECIKGIINKPSDFFNLIYTDTSIKLTNYGK